MTTRLHPNDTLLVAASGELKDVLAALEAAEINDANVGDLIDRHDQLISVLENTAPATAAGAVAKAKAIIAEGPEHNLPSRAERLAMSLANDILRAEALDAHAAKTGSA